MKCPLCTEAELDEDGYCFDCGEVFELIEDEDDASGEELESLEELAEEELEDEDE